jgi:hypothetical protein
MKILEIRIPGIGLIFGSVFRFFACAKMKNSILELCVKYHFVNDYRGPLRSSRALGLLKKIA